MYDRNLLKKIIEFIEECLVPLEIVDFIPAIYLIIEKYSKANCLYNLAVVKEIEEMFAVVTEIKEMFTDQSGN